MGHDTDPGKEIELYPELNPIYEGYFYFGKLRPSMASECTIEPSTQSVSSAYDFSSPLHSDAYIEAFTEKYLNEDKQTLPSLADWSLTRPPSPKFTMNNNNNNTTNKDFIENNLNNFSSGNGESQESELSSLLRQLQETENEQQKSTKDESPTRYLNRYIAVFGEEKAPSKTDTPTYELLAKNRYMCNLCKEVINGVHEKFVHRNKHLGRTFQCQYCAMVFPTSIDVVRHVHITHRTSTQKCPKCDFTATNMQSYFKHMDSAHPVVEKPPSPSPQEMPQWTTLESMPSNHEAYSEIPEDVPSLDELTPTFHSSAIEGGIVCGEMDNIGQIENNNFLSVFTDQQVQTLSLQQQLMWECSPAKKIKLENGTAFPKPPSPDDIHSGSSSSPSPSDLSDSSERQCEICGLMVDSKQTYINHLWQSHITVPNACPFPDCGKVFGDEAGLSKHLSVTHTNNRKHKCTSCKKSFKTLSQCRKHEDEVHINSETRPFQCPWPDCDKRFKATKHLSVHLLIHTDSKPIQCHLCDYRCRQRNSINYHYKTKHPGHSPPKAQVCEMIKNGRAQLAASSFNYAVPEIKKE